MMDHDGTKWYTISEYCMNLYHGFPEFTVGPIVRTCNRACCPATGSRQRLGALQGPCSASRYLQFPIFTTQGVTGCHLLTFKDCTRIVCISYVCSLFHYISDTRRRTRCILASISTLQVSSPSSVSSCKTKWAKFHVFFYLNSSHVYCVSMTKKLQPKTRFCFPIWSWLECASLETAGLAVKLQSERTNVEYSWCHWHLKGSK